LYISALTSINRARLLVNPSKPFVKILQFYKVMTDVNNL
jgi:hypothetical protein